MLKYRLKLLPLVGGEVGSIGQNRKLAVRRKHASADTPPDKLGRRRVADISCRYGLFGSAGTDALNPERRQ